MPEYLLCIVYHEPESFAAWNRGLVEDYESTTGLFVIAESSDEAIAWGEEVGRALLQYANNDTTLDWKGFGYSCWVEESPQASGWSHCLGFFQHVRAGRWPDLAQMTTAAYKRWMEHEMPGR